jgi:hypothetical protein
VTSRLVLLCSLLCALIVPAGAAGQPTSTNFRFAAALPISQAGGSAHGMSVWTAPSEITMPHVGRATVEARWTQSNAITCGPPPCLNSTEGRLLVGVATGGGTLVIRGSAGPFFVPSGSPFPPTSAVMTGPWIVSEATDRFAEFAGTGTWSVSLSIPPPPALRTMTVMLVGHLGKH